MTTEGTGPIVIPCYLVSGVPYALEVDASGNIKVNVQASALPTGAATQATLAALLTELAQKIEPADLNITASRELAVLLNALVGVVETPLVAFTGGILKAAPGLGALADIVRVGVLASAAEYTEVLNVAGPGVLEALDFTTDYSASRLDVTVDGEPLRILDKSGATGRQATPAYLTQVGGETAWWKQDLYDDTNNYYCFHLKRAIQYDSTLKIEILQVSGDDKNVGVWAWYRSIG